MKKFVFVFSTLLWFAGVIWVITQVNSEKKYSGENINFSVDQDYYFVTDADSTIIAASKNFFVLRTKSGLSMVSTAIEKPLGWEYSEYYTISPRLLQKGEWLIEKGESISVRLTNKPAINVAISLKPDVQRIVAVLLFTIGCLIWRGLFKLIFKK